MLVEFSVTNFRSVKEKQTLSLIAGPGAELRSDNTFIANSPTEVSLLRSAVIYGPNASGKSNLLKALRTMEKLVIGSAASKQQGDELPVMPFKLSKSALGQPSEFEVQIIADGVRYQYGFSATSTRVHDEWLLAFPKGRAQTWFRRSWNSDTNRHEWTLGANLLGEKQVWQRSTRENALFLSTAVSLNSEQLKPVFNWFKRTLRVADIRGWASTFSASLCEESGKAQVLEFLRAADLNIQDILVRTENFDPELLPQGMPSPIREAMVDELSGHEFKTVHTVHTGSGGESVKFDMDDEESDGTQRLFAFAGPWIDTLTNGYVLFVDELHNSLHPQIVEYMVRQFHSSSKNPHNAQLVFTTHETAILNQDLFRRDQVWFCERNAAQESRLYPLTDFRPRKGRENLEAGYLSGRYGAVPITRNVSSFVD